MGATKTGWFRAQPAPQLTTAPLSADLQHGSMTAATRSRKPHAWPDPAKSPLPTALQNPHLLAQIATGSARPFRPLLRGFVRLTHPIRRYGQGFRDSKQQRYLLYALQSATHRLFQRRQRHTSASAAAPQTGRQQYRSRYSRAHIQKDHLCRTRSYRPGDRFHQPQRPETATMNVR